MRILRKFRREPPIVTLQDLPSFRITSIRPKGTEYRLLGEFNHLTSVREQCCWLYHGDASLPGDLIELDPETKRGTFLAYWEPDSQFQVGAAFPWVDGYYQAYHVTMIVVPEAAWSRVRFQPSPAQHFVQDGAHGWQKSGQKLPEGATALHVEEGGWDHEHCALCWETISETGERFGYVDAEDHWLCDECGRLYALRRSLGFLMPSG